MKLTYWVSETTDDVPAYNIRTRTRRECLALREEYGTECYKVPRKVTVEYRNGFDLMMKCSGSDRNWWEFSQ